MLFIWFFVVVLVINVLSVLNVFVGNIVLVLMLGCVCLCFFVSCSSGEIVIRVVGFFFIFCSCCVRVSVRYLFVELFVSMICFGL